MISTGVRASVDIEFIGPFIEPFIDAALKTMEIQCSLTAKAGRPFLKGQQSQESVDIAAVLSLNSPTVMGSVAICFPRSVFLKLMTRMLGEAYQEITPDLHDGASEILNITFGQAKVILNEKGYGLEKSIPTIILGSNLSVCHMTKTATIIIPFESDLGRFYIEVAATFSEKTA